MEFKKGPTRGMNCSLPPTAFICRRSSEDGPLLLLLRQLQVVLNTGVICHGQGVKEEEGGEEEEKKGLVDAVNIAYLLNADTWPNVVSIF